VPPDRETAYRVAHGGTRGGLADDKRKIAAMKEELQSLDEPTRRFTAVCSLRLSVLFTGDVGRVAGNTERTSVHSAQRKGNGPL